MKGTKIIEIVPKYNFEYEKPFKNRYLEIFKVASDEKIDHIHLVRLYDPQRMFLALKTDSKGMNYKFSFNANKITKVDHPDPNSNIVVLLFMVIY